jgi:inorganic triphosphatase YgiF
VQVQNKLLKYIREHAWRWSSTAMKTAAHQARLAGDKNRAKLKADVGLVARDAVEEVLNKLAAAARPAMDCSLHEFWRWTIISFFDLGGAWQGEQAASA